MSPIIFIGSEQFSFWEYSSKKKCLIKSFSGDLDRFSSWYSHRKQAYLPTRWVLETVKTQVSPLDESTPSIGLESETIDFHHQFLQVQSHQDAIKHSVKIDEGILISSLEVIPLEFLQAYAQVNPQTVHGVLEGNSNYFIFNQGTLLGIHSKKIFNDRIDFVNFVQNKHYLNIESKFTPITDTPLKDVLQTETSTLSIQSSNRDLYESHIKARDLQSKLNLIYKPVMILLVIAIFVWSSIIGLKTLQFNQSRDQLGSQWDEFNEIKTRLDKLKDTHQEILSLEDLRTNTHKYVIDVTNSLPNKVWLDEIKYVQGETIYLVGYSHDEEYIDDYLKTLESIEGFQWIKLKYSEWLTQYRIKRKAGLKQAQNPLYKFLIEVKL